MSSALLIASNLAIFTENHERKGDIFYPAVHELRRLADIEKAATALIKCKGRYHAEQNTNALATALGIELPFVDSTLPDPFGYFRAEPFGWTDCAEDDEGAIALYEHPTDHLTDASKMMQGDVVVTTNSKGECVLVSRQDEEGRILNVIWDKEKGLKLSIKNNNLLDQDDINVVDLNRPSAIELQHAEIGIATPITELLNPVNKGE